jgi:3-oxoacyl-[acyl-carrier-protein] synthase-1
MSANDLAIVGLGATTAVGRNAVLSAAAIRAGIVRPRPIVDPEILDDDTHEPVPITGHPSRGLTDGFTLFGRWLRMATAAVRDLLQSLPEREKDPAEWRRTRLLLCTPTPDPLVFLAAPEETLAAVRDQVAAALLEETGLAIPDRLVEVLPYGHVAFALGAHQARAHIGVDAMRVLLVAVDSMLDPLLLENLASQGRVKHAGSPVGFAPGEAAVAMLLTSPGTMPRQPAAIIRGVFYELTPCDVAAETNRRLADVCSNALADAGVAELLGDVFLDLTGEVWRARQWGDALPHLHGKFPDEVLLPAVNVGDTGAASGALAACLAARSFARGYAKGDYAAVVSMAEYGGAACVVLARAGSGTQ